MNYLVSVLILLLGCGAQADHAPSDVSAPALFADQPACERDATMPVGLRLSDYQRPTPDCVPNAITLNTSQLQQLIAERQPLLIDVLGVMERNDPDFGHEWLLNEPRYSLPSAVWLPNIGRGELEPHLQTYLSDNLSRLTAANKAKPLVFFCVADCWMSWNAAQRVYDLGYTQVYWYKGGTDDWKLAKLPTVELEPIPISDNTNPVTKSAN